MALTLCICFFSCYGNSPPSTAPPTESQGTAESQNPTEKPKPNDGSYTLLIYMCGSSLESRNGAATDDIAELLRADIPDKTNIIIETGGAWKWKDDRISYDKIQRFQVTDGKLVLLDENRLSSMGDAETLRSFIDWGTETFPSEETALILWDHGGGFLKGICMDELYRGDWLTVGELDKALSGSRFDEKFAFIGFDCCLMANYETALTVSKYTDTMIASEGDEPVGGWDYRAIAEAIAKASEKTDFYDTVLSAFAKANADRADYTLSVIDLSKLDRVRSVLSGCMEKARTSGGRLSFPDAVKEIRSIGSGFTYLYDLGDLAAYFGVECDLDGVLKTVSSQERNASGLSICCPIADEKALAEYLLLSEDRDFCAYLKAVQSTK